MKPLVPLFALLLAWHAGAARAQEDTLALPFRALTIENGLSQGMVNCIVQDKYGFMWFGTKDGLNRYDGYHFTVYRHDPSDSTSLGDNYIHSLLEDREGRLWVGTRSGLDLFDRVQERFTHVPIGEREVDDAVRSIAQDAHNDLWISRTAGVVKLTFTGKRSALGPPDLTTKHFLERLSFVSADHSGTIWASELDHTSYRILPDHAGNDRLDTLLLDRPVGNTHNGRDLSDVTGMVVIEDTVRHRLYGLHKFGVVKLDPGSAQVKTLLIYEQPFKDMRTTFSTVDANGRLWIAAYPGLYIFDPEKRSMTRVVPRDPNLEGQTVSTRCTYRDRNGLICIGTIGYGILTHEPRGERFRTVTSASCGLISKGDRGRVVVAQENTFLSVFDPATRTWPIMIPWTAKENDPELQLYGHGEMRGVMEDESGQYWFNHAGVLRFDLARDAIFRYPLDAFTRAAFPGESGYQPWYFDGDSIIWCCTERNLGRFDRRTGEYRYFKYPFDPASSELSVQVIHRDTQGLFWLGTLHGLLRFDPASAEWRRYANSASDPNSLSVDAVYSIAPDPSDPVNILWVGTNGGGLNRFDKRTGKCTRFTTRQGLPNDVVYGILADEAGRLWMSTNKGISRFDPATRNFRNFDATDGLQGDEFNRYAYCQLADGTLFFGGVKGFNYFDPKDIVDDSTASPIRITNIKLVNKVLDHREADSPLKQPAYLSQGMTIPMSDNMVTFEFASMEFSAPAEHRYQYKLDGFDKDWIMSGHERTAIYTNLDPGQYTFHVRGDGRDGIWDAQGASFQLEVLPPWWRTRWFYGLCALALGGAVVLYMRRQRHHKQFLEKTVQERTAQLSTAKERAEQSERIKQQFLANMSHEIRTPMNAIVGMSNALRRDAPTDPGTRDRYVDAIASSSENLLGIVNEILDLSKIEAGRLELEKVRFAPRTVLEDVIAVMQYRAKEKRLELSSRVDDAVPGTVVGDPTRLRQVLMNLVGNAIKFTERGSVEVCFEVAATVHVEDGTAAGDMIGLRGIVTDTGIGIAPDRLARVFDEFMQAETDHTRRFGGSGLGLTICQRLVDMQGGTIGVESEAGKGSVFTVNIPYALASPEEEAVVAEGKPDERKLTGLHILLVEDNKLNVMVAQVELQNAIPNVRIDVAGNGKVALEMLQANSCDLILMDVQMPVMDGYEATLAIRALPGIKALTPILAMTANVQETEVRQCMEAGMDGFVPKPFKQDVLMAAIRKVVEAN